MLLTLLLVTSLLELQIWYSSMNFPTLKLAQTILDWYRADNIFLLWFAKLPMQVVLLNRLLSFLFHQAEFLLIKPRL